MRIHVLGLACGLALLVLSASACDQPRYQGRTASSWQHDLDDQQDHRRRQACEALGAMGPDASAAAEAIAQRLEDVNPGVQEFCLDALVSIGQASVAAVEPRLQSNDPVLRFQAATAIISINPDDVRAGKTLLDTLTAVGNVELARRAQRVVVRVGAPMVALLVPLLHDPYEPVRIQAAQTLGRMEKRAGEHALDGLGAALADSAWGVRQAAVEAIARIGEKDQVAALIRPVLKDEQEDVAVTAALMMKYIGAREAATGYAADDGSEAAPALALP